MNIALVPFLSYLTLNNIVTLKSGLESLKVIENDAILKLGCGFLFAFYSNCLYLALFPRYSDLLVENRETFPPALNFITPAGGDPVGIS